MDEIERLRALFARKRFTTMEDVVKWAGEDIVLPLGRIATSDAPLSERRAAVLRLLEEWDFELDDKPEP
jgi:hypothetical protein